MTGTTDGECISAVPDSLNTRQSAICRSLRHHVTSDVTPRQVRVSQQHVAMTTDNNVSAGARVFALQTKWSANTQNTTFALSTINHKFSLKQAYQHHAPSALCSTSLCDRQSSVVYHLLIYCPATLTSVF